MVSLGNPYGLGRADPSFREGIQIRVANGKAIEFQIRERAAADRQGPPDGDSGLVGLGSSDSKAVPSRTTIDAGPYCETLVSDHIR
jgi:hypothetical protein